MPIYEYECRGCGHQFELLLLPAREITPACPSCRSEELQRLVSGFAVNSEETTRANVQKARKQMAESKNYKDQKIAEHEEIEHHHH